MQATAAIVLKPLSHPDLGELHVDKLLAIGRSEQPFASYGRELVIDLSRKHARIYSANHAVYVADLGSKNGTTVNRVAVGDKPRVLQHGDEVCFGGALTYRVELPVETNAAERVAIVLGVTLTPERDDLHPLVINRFPYLVSKVDEAFARYQHDRADQLHYLSRRHAHIFLKGGLPFIEDLGSTNGTCVDGVRLEGNAVELKDEAMLAFGGDYFTYRVRVDRVTDVETTVIRPAAIVRATAAATSAAAEPVVRAKAAAQVAQPADVAIAPAAAPAVAPMIAPVAQSMVDAEIAAAVAAAMPVAQNLPAEEPAQIDRTTFVAAPNSFLEIFCVDQPKRVADDASDTETEAGDEAEAQAQSEARPRSRFAILLSELRQALASDEEGSRRGLWIGAAVLGTLAAVILGLYLWGASERELKNLMTESAFDKAAAVAHERLQREGDNSELKSIATEAALRAHVPAWIKLINARDFSGANTELARLRDFGRHNQDLNALLGGLEWIGRLEQLLVARGGVDAPIRVYADEEAIRDLLKRWNDDAQGHQRALGRIASHVREFRDPYAGALTKLRRLQSEALVHLAAIDRLKALVRAELDRDTPDALQNVLQEYADKYPKLGGLDAVRADLRQYLEIDAQARTRNLPRLVVATEKARFATPAFADKFNALKTSDRFPPAAVMQQYQAVSRAWRAGDARQAFGALQAMSAGPWTDAASRELARKRGVSEQFAALQKLRGTANYADRLLAFHGAIDLDEDVYFAAAVQADVDAIKDKAQARAQEMLNRSRSIWQRYRDNGAIDGRQRLEGAISERYRTQAALLNEAYELTRKGVQIYAQLHLTAPAPSIKAQEEIKAELDQQRKSLVEMRSVLEPGLLKAKLALLGGSDEERKPI